MTRKQVHVSLTEKLQWDAAEVAAIIGVSEGHLWRMISASGFPKGYKVGSRTFWRPADVRRWVDTQAGENRRRGA